MSEAEWIEFHGMTFAPWRPRTPGEFNAMCDLGRERHLADNVGGLGFLNAFPLDSIKFGPHGEINFPLDKRREAYLKEYGTWPNDEQLQKFESGEMPSTPTLTLVGKSEK